MLSRIVRFKGIRQIETMAMANYHEKVIDHSENLRNVGSLDKNDPTVGTGIVGAPACGDAMEKKPSFIEKITFRFKGIPLKGELNPPKAVFDNFDKKNYFEQPPIPKDFKEFPERDLVNFPYPERPLYPPKLRLIFVPDHWLKGIEKITGTSGPYLAISGFIAFLLNKEFLAWDVDLMRTVIFVMPVYFFLRYAFGYRIANYAHTLWEDKVNSRKDYIKSELREADDFRKNSKEEATSLAAAQENFPTIFRENLALQLESTYRKNVDYAWVELKRRLDYLQEVQETKERFAKEILLKTITEGVRKQIETNEGGIRDKYMDQCISQLKTLAK